MFELASPFYKPQESHPPTPQMRSQQNLNYLKLLTKALYNMSLSDEKPTPFLWTHDTPRPQNTPPKLHSVRPHQNIPKNPNQVLSAPSISIDFYSHLLSADESKFSIGLDKNVYISNIKPEGSPITINDKAEICCTYLIPHSKLFIGNCANSVSFIDYNQNKAISDGLIESPVNVAEAADKQLFLGCKNGSIIISDIKNNKASFVSHFAKHKEQICSLKIEGYNLAAGSNDDVVKIWDVRNNKKPLALLLHGSAVRAVAWSPWNKTHLFTGGGVNDRQLRIFDTQTLTVIDQINLQAQISEIVCNQRGPKEIAVSLGGDKNNLQFFSQQKNNSLIFLGESEVEQFKIISLVSAKNSETLLTAQANETLGIWNNAFTIPKKAQQVKDMGSSGKELGSFSVNIR